MKKIIYIITQIIMIITASVNVYSNNKKDNPIITYKSIIFYYKNQYAKTVYLKSNLDNWHLNFPLQKEINQRGKWNGLWKTVLSQTNPLFQLKKGKYKYKFIVDGEYTQDPLNPNKEKNRLGNILSFFIIKQNLLNYQIEYNPSKIQNKKNYYRFIYKSFTAKEVYIVGNFNHWNNYSHPLNYNKNGFWHIDIHIPKGKYYYNFLVDQKYIKDPLNTNRVSNIINKSLSYFQIPN